jgi:HSP20 family protein
MSIFKSPMRNYLPLINRERSDMDFYKEIEDWFNRSNSLMGIDSEFKKISMSLNIQESKEGYHLEAELPGVSKDDVHISMKDDCLIIKGEKKSFNDENKDQYHRIERSHGSFYRAIQMPKDADREKINAQLKDGVLKIDVMKSSGQLQGEKKINIS